MAIHGSGSDSIAVHTATSKYEMLTKELECSWRKEEILCGTSQNLIIVCSFFL